MSAAGENHRRVVDVRGHELGQERTEHRARRYDAWPPAHVVADRFDQIERPFAAARVDELRRARHRRLGHFHTRELVEEVFGDEQARRRVPHDARLVADVGDDLRQCVQLEELDTRAVVQRFGSPSQLDRRGHPPRRPRIAIRVWSAQCRAVQIQRHVVHRPRVDRDRADGDAGVERLRDGGPDLRPHRLDVPVQMPVALDERRRESVQFLEPHDVALERAEHHSSARRAEIDRQVARAGAHRPRPSSSITDAWVSRSTPPRAAPPTSARGSPSRGTRAPDRVRHPDDAAPRQPAGARRSRMRA